MQEKFKLLLISPPWALSKKSEDYLTTHIPIGLAYIAAYCEKNNVDVKILDALAEGDHNQIASEGGGLQIGLSEQQITERIKDFQPNLVGISNFFSSQVGNMYRTARLVKKAGLNTPVVVGGVHPSSAPYECLKDKNIDFVVQGEGELTTLNLIKFLLGEKEINKVKGVYYKNSGQMQYTGSTTPVSNLDSMPFPAYHLLPMEKYFEASRADPTMRGAAGEKWLPLISSRGCPYNCIFCGAHLLVGKKWRARSPKNFVDEISFLVEEYGVHNFRFEDSNFTFDTERVEQICDEIIGRDLKIKWSVPNGIRADRITYSLVLKMKNAGCTTVTIGIEHGDQKYLNEMIKKHLSLEYVVNAIRVFKKFNIPISGFFILNFPNETKELINKTIAFAVGVAKRGCMPLFGFAMPLPGTELERVCKQNNLLTKKGMIKNKNIPKPELIKLRRKARLKVALTLFIYQPRVFMQYPFIRYMLKDLKNPRSFLRRIKLLMAKL